MEEQKTELELVKASEIIPKSVEWLWYPYIPFGKVTLLQGDPGDGKSQLMLAVSALVSKGKPLPFAVPESAFASRCSLGFFDRCTVIALAVSSAGRARR